MPLGGEGGTRRERETHRKKMLLGEVGYITLLLLSVHLLKTSSDKLSCVQETSDAVADARLLSGTHVAGRAAHAFIPTIVREFIDKILNQRSLLLSHHLLFKMFLLSSPARAYSERTWERK